MRNGTRGQWGLLLGLISTAAGAQAPAIAWAVSAEYRPSLAVLEVAASDLASIERAEQLEGELLALLSGREQFAQVLSPMEVRERLGALEASCTTRECLAAALGTLKLQRAVRLSVNQDEEGSRVTLWGLDPSQPGLVQAELVIADRVTSRTPAERDLEFLGKAIPRLRAALWALAVPNGKLIVENTDPTLTVSIDGTSVGRGRVELLWPAGDARIAIGGTLYEPSEQLVTLRPGETTTIALHLVPRPVAPLVAQQPVRLMSRPGVYVALSGLTLVALGAGLGIGSLVTGARVAQPGSPVQVTRLDAMNAPAQGVWAAILLASGVALSAGGIAWVALTPSKMNVEPGAAHGWTLSFGGSL